MQSGGTIVSKLHNYQMYDAMLSKLSILLEVPKEFFVSINFLYKDNKGLKLLEEKYIEAERKYKLPCSYEMMMRIFDYVYCVDLCAYKDNPDKNIILSGQETTTLYEIHPNFGKKLSQKTQKEFIDLFDRSTCSSLSKNGGDFKLFAKYIIDNYKRDELNKLIGSNNKEETTIIQAK